MKTLKSSLAVCVLVAALGGCATDIPPASALIDGPLTAAPAGWTSYCVRHPEDAGCRS
jgi:hypothetical protein